MKGKTFVEVVTVAFLVSSIGSQASPLNQSGIHPLPAPKGISDKGILLAHITDLESRVYKLEQFNSCITHRIAWSKPHREGTPLVRWKNSCVRPLTKPAHLAQSSR